jgi:hypothetical protein
VNIETFVSTKRGEVSMGNYNLYEAYSEYYEENELSELEDVQGISLSKTKNNYDEDYDENCHKEINKIGSHNLNEDTPRNIKPSEPIHGDYDDEDIDSDETGSDETGSDETISGYINFDGPDFRIPEVVEKENKAVIKYQKTGDLDILAQLYTDRIPTLNYWANKNKHIDNYNTKDIRGELTKTFLKAIDGYKHKKKVVIDGESKVLKRNFNAYLFQSFKHDIINICTKKKAKKRTPYSADENIVYAKLLSLDYSYTCNDSTSKINLKDTISDDKSKDAVDTIILDEMISILSDKEPPHVREFFEGISMGKKPSVLLREFKTVEGKIRVRSDVAGKIKRARKNDMKIVDEILHERIDKRFKLLDFSINSCTINYKIELHKTKETDDINRRIRKIRNNKDAYIARMGLKDRRDI